MTGHGIVVNCFVSIRLDWVSNVLYRICRPDIWAVMYFVLSIGLVLGQLWTVAYT